MRLLDRSTPQIRILELEHLKIPDYELLQCLKKLSSVEEFYLQYCTISEVVLQALQVPPSADTPKGDWLLPRLSTIDFASVDGITADVDPQFHRVPKYSPRYRAV